MTVYYQCSRDERIPDVLYRVLKNYHGLLADGTISLFKWGKYRWFEAFVAIDLLQSIYNDEWITDLARILCLQGADYRKLSELWKRPLNKWTFDTHIVNLAMMVKYEALCHDILGKEYTDTAVELMYSYEWLYAVTGDSKWAERLEVLAFNALPATLSDDMWTHQYDQMSNQIACVRFPGKSLFGTNGKEAHLFGLEPNFGCCTANFNQGWPKFALSAFMHNGNRIISAVPVPSEVVFAIKAGENRIINISFETKPELFDRPHDLKSVRCGSLVFSLPISEEIQAELYPYGCAKLRMTKMPLI